MSYDKRALFYFQEEIDFCLYFEIPKEIEQDRQLAVQTGATMKTVRRQKLSTRKKTSFVFVYFLVEKPITSTDECKNR